MLAALFVGLAIAAVLPMSGCKRQESAAAPQPQVRKDLYTVRGIVTELPSPDAPLAEFKVRHEAMPHFRAEGGKLGMDTMIMPFPLATGLSLDGLKVGDQIMLSFEVDFDPETDRLLGYRATGVQPLPSGTILDFTPLHTPAAQSPQ